MSETRYMRQGKQKDKRINRPCMMLFLVSLLLSLVSWSGSSLAVVELNEFSSEQVRVRYLALIEELRCPMCQNQNLAGSDSQIAVDLRRQVLVMLEDGYSDQEIRDYLHERYGDFILYNPPLEGKTLLVWVLPILFFISGIIAAVFIIRKATRNAALNNGYDDGEESDEELAELDFKPSVETADLSDESESGLASKQEK